MGGREELRGGRWQERQGERHHLAPRFTFSRIRIELTPYFLLSKMRLGPLKAATATESTAHSDSIENHCNVVHMFVKP
jgi:hypothetical protein